MLTPRPEQEVADAIGRVMAFWGFRKNLGRIWALLYLSPHALTAPQLCEQLQLSTGSVSMALNELQRWGAVKKRFEPGDRRDHYEAEQDIWGTVSRVMQQREVREIDQALEAFRTAETELAREAAGDPQKEADARFRIARIAELEELAVAGKDLLALMLGQKAPDELVDRERAPPRRLIPRAPRED